MRKANFLEEKCFICRHYVIYVMLIDLNQSGRKSNYKDPVEVCGMK